MSVHVGELHSEVSAQGPPPGDATAGTGTRVEPTEEWLREARCRADQLAARGAAEGFDD